jgi:hypothetical protein
MNMLAWLVSVCLRIAVARWPEAQREERRREWSAELHVMGAWSRLRFALSLAWSPPVDDDGVPRGWRETLPAFGRGLRPVLALMGMGFGCIQIANGVPGIGIWILTLSRGYPPGSGPYWPDGGLDWAANAVSIASLALAAVPMFWIGRLLARHIPVIWAHRGRLGSTGSAIVAPALLVAGVLLVHVMQYLPAGPRYGTPV